MKNNTEKWNHYKELLDSKTKEFIDSQKFVYPSKYYFVYPIGTIAERFIIDVEYSHHRHEGNKYYFNGKVPTKKDVLALQCYAESNIPFTTEYIYFKYKECWNKDNNLWSSSSVKFNDVLNQNGLFYSLEDADKKASHLREEFTKDKEFKEQHKKDKNYNYVENGYKFLGWQNGWKHEYFDEDGTLCSVSGKPRKSFGYVGTPEYNNCMNLKHRKIEVQHTQSGSENTVSCPVCKLYWKYDCSG